MMFYRRNSSSLRFVRLFGVAGGGLGVSWDDPQARCNMEAGRMGGLEDGRMGGLEDERL